MNAGAMGGETFRQVTSVRYIDQDGEFHTKTPDELEVQYRGVPSLAINYAVSATFTGVSRELHEIEQIMDESMHKRRNSQPRESSAGCIFKNPQTIPAGKLIDELGLKGARFGGAKVSEVHGNFIVNDNHASASDVLSLISMVKDAALKKRGVELHTEVQIVGEDKES